uniref:Uncharacterized protein n=1 Tax=Meloidogyne floridensis TaxID=298350 RepID=A0A915NXB1_9BILA
MSGPRTTNFTSICQSRRICSTCNHIIFGQQELQLHDCVAEQLQQRRQLQLQSNGQSIDCGKCRGTHLFEHPCYIQPLQSTEHTIISEEENLHEYSIGERKQDYR